MIGETPHIITDSRDSKFALCEQGRLVDYFIVSSGEERLGQLAYARITQLFAAHHRAEITLPDGTDASLRLSPKQPYKVGDIIPMTVTAMPRQHKPLPEGWGAVIKRGTDVPNPDAIIAEIEALLAPLPLIAALPASQPTLIYGGDEVRLQAALALNGPAQIHVNDDAALWDDIDQMAANALALPYEMANGARLFCEVTQACTVIDVDSGTSGLSPIALAEAALEEVLWLIRLTSLSGVILIDLPRLPFKAQQKLLDKFSTIALRDRRHPEILGFSRAGLLEITVRHGRAPLTVRHPGL